MPASVLAFDSDSKEVQLKPGEQTAHFCFYMTNVSGAELQIKALRPSCGCTIAKMPSQPWRLAPGESAPIEADMHVYGNQGMISKSLTVETSAGNKYLVLRAGVIAPVVAIKPPAYDATQRRKNQQIATMDRQLTLRGECAVCHVQPAVGKTGRELFVAACAICHLPENRSPLVFDLQSRQKPMPPDYWKMFITYGKPGTMMPAFAKEQTGFLTSEQTASLMNYLVREFPKEGKIVYEMPKVPDQGVSAPMSGAEFLPSSIGGFSVPANK